MNAIFSPCGKYRYILRRSLDLFQKCHKPILFIMLNPSTADAHNDDPTIRRCISFAKRENYSRLTIINLFALRATDPKELKTVIDPVGLENNMYLRNEIQNHSHSLIVCAWGSNPITKSRVDLLKEWFDDVDWYCLGFTKSGSPRHPLYVKSDQPLIRF